MQERSGAALLEAVRPARGADRDVLYDEGSAGSRLNVSVSHCSQNLGFALVRKSDSTRLPPASEALESSGRTSWIFSTYEGAGLTEEYSGSLFSEYVMV
jgi:hypothetical protein